jgi:hypothetical protein
VSGKVKAMRMAVYELSDLPILLLENLQMAFDVFKRIEQSIANIKSAIATIAHESKFPFIYRVSSEYRSLQNDLNKQVRELEEHYKTIQNVVYSFAFPHIESYMRQIEKTDPRVALAILLTSPASSSLPQADLSSTTLAFKSLSISVDEAKAAASAVNNSLETKVPVSDSVTSRPLVGETAAESLSHVSYNASSCASPGSERISETKARNPTRSI